MGYVPMMIYIILPQTFKIIAPQIGNTFVANIKDTSVLNVIAVTELFYITKVAAGTYFRMFEAYTITALIYLTLTLLFNGLLKLIEKYMARKLRGFKSGSRKINQGIRWKEKRNVLWQDNQYLSLMRE